MPITLLAKICTAYLFLLALLAITLQLGVLLQCPVPQLGLLKLVCGMHVVHIRLLFGVCMPSMPHGRRPVLTPVVVMGLLGMLVMKGVGMRSKECLDLLHAITDRLQAQQGGCTSTRTLSAGSTWKPCKHTVTTIAGQCTAAVQCSSHRN